MDSYKFQKIYGVQSKTVFSLQIVLKKLSFDILTRYKKKISDEILRAITVLNFKDYILFNDSSMF
jgi:hypothetical protein